MVALESQRAIWKIIETDPLNTMLGPLSEKGVARKMDISQATVHSYIKDLYKNYNVKNRLEMIQLWLNPLSTIQS